MNKASGLAWLGVRLFDGRMQHEEPMAVLVEGDTIRQVVPAQGLSEASLEGYEIVARQGVMTPGLIDCHTHVVYGGNRAAEFEARLEGADYKEIARRGGGILSTVRHTRAASEEELFAAALPRRLDAPVHRRDDLVDGRVPQDRRRAGQDLCEHGDEREDISPPRIPNRKRLSGIRRK